MKHENNNRKIKQLPHVAETFAEVWAGLWREHPGLPLCGKSHENIPMTKRLRLGRTTAQPVFMP
ncbi:MAG: hypothetical protein WC999_08485 [Hydrogenophaga sp.]